RSLVSVSLRYVSGDHRDLHSFPTRRSSDLDQGTMLNVRNPYTGSLLPGFKTSGEMANGPLTISFHEDPNTGKMMYEVKGPDDTADRKSTRLNSSHVSISYAVFCLKKKNK